MENEMNDEDEVNCEVCGNEVHSGTYYNYKNIPCCSSKCLTIVQERFSGKNDK
jgi:endogenous inhibitor of DNA gyrase (YacG/DUF329 family)